LQASGAAWTHRKTSSPVMHELHCSPDRFSQVRHLLHTAAQLTETA